MIIDIQKTVLRYKVRGFVWTVIICLLAVLMLFPYLLPEKLIGMNKYVLLIIIVSVYLGTIGYNALRNYNYIYFSDEGEKIILRYFSTGYFTSKKNSIEIPKKEFRGFSNKKEMIGFREYIILNQKTKAGVAHYPKVSITALTRAEKNELTKALEKSALK